MQLYTTKNNLLILGDNVDHYKNKQIYLPELYTGEYKTVDIVSLFINVKSRYVGTGANRYFFKKETADEECFRSISYNTALHYTKSHTICELFADTLDDYKLIERIRAICRTDYFSEFKKYTVINLEIVDKKLFNIDIKVNKNGIPVTERAIRQIKRLMPNVEF